MKPVGKDFNQLAKINPPIGDIIKNGFAAIALILYIADFHVKIQVGGNLPRQNHGFIFQRNGLFPFFNVHGAGMTVDFP